MNARQRLDLTPLLDDEPTGLEAGVTEDDHHSLRLWLRLLACSTDIETEIRRRLRVQFGMTLARFDYLGGLSATDFDCAAAVDALLPTHTPSP